MKRQLAILTLAALTALTVGCSKDPRVEITRPNPETQIDIAPQWNDVDSRDTAQKMVADSLEFDWYRDFRLQENRKPVLVVGPVRNLSRDYVDTEIFTKDIEREYIRQGDVRVVAMSGPERKALFGEILEQQEFASPATAKRIGNATGADFMLLGRIGYIHQTSDDGLRSIRYYKVDLEVIHLETTEKVWLATHEIKKDVVRRNHEP
jgi:penicillin-binding protein activator